MSSQVYSQVVAVY